MGVDVNSINPRNIRLFHNGGGVLPKINKDYYLNQVRGYMNYLRNISNKEVEGYLYSVIDSTYKEIK